MYSRWIPFLNKRKVILASGSPRRKEILSDLGIVFEVKTSDYPEDLSKDNISPVDYVKQTCENKFDYFIANNSDMQYDMIITADSIVEFNGKILEKPKDENEVREWFKQFSDNKVIVHTSMVIGLIEDRKCIKRKQFISTTNVCFDHLSDELIEDYIKTGEPFDKAGGFGIQAKAKSFIKGIEGDFYTVVGFAVNMFTTSLTLLLTEQYGEEGYKI